MKVLELFSGTGHLSSEFRLRGHSTLTVDWSPQSPADWHADIGTITSSDIIERLGGRPDIIFAAFDCTTFSRASRGHHRKLNPLSGIPEAITPYAKRCDEIDQHVIDLIHELKPKVWIIENPRGHLRRMPWMKQMGLPQTTTYCSYGLDYRKETDFWSNINLKLISPCQRGAFCHSNIHTSGGKPYGVMALRNASERSVYPQGLIRWIVSRCEDAVLGHHKLSIAEQAMLTLQRIRLVS